MTYTGEDASHIKPACAVYCKSINFEGELHVTAGSMSTVPHPVLLFRSHLGNEKQRYVKYQPLIVVGVES